VSAHVFDDVPAAVADAALDAAAAELERLEALLSTFRPASEISRVNRRELHLLDASPEVLDVLDACTWLEEVSDGAFCAYRPDRPDQLDPAGFVKGWAVERAVRLLDEHGLRSWYLGAGGDLEARGTLPEGKPWKVAVADPHVPGEIVAVLEVVDGAVATSGTAERGHHVWDGRDGRAAGELASITVTGPHLTWADALATAAFARGRDGLAWLERFEGYEGLGVTPDGALLATPGLVASGRAAAGSPSPRRRAATLQ
jgi:thiamine biosynthesis lipoprotein